MTDPQKIERTRGAIFVLFWLAPFTAEVLSGSTPLVVFFTNPVSLILNTLLYSCGALIIREVARRNGLGWGGILWLGAAYGVFEEGLVLNTWADPWATVVCKVVDGVPKGICDYGRVAGVNLLWALPLTVYHAVVSITIPILLAELIFPRLAARSWLGRKGLMVCAVGSGIALLLGILINLNDFQQHGAILPLGPYLVEMLLLLGFVLLAFRHAAPRPAPPRGRSPRLWWLRILGGLTGLFVTAGNQIYTDAHLPFLIGLAIDVVVFATGIWLVLRWSRRADWNDRHRLALATGWLCFFITLYTLIAAIAGRALASIANGTAFVALAYLIGLIILARRTDRRTRADSIAMPSSFASEPVYPHV